jgi:hypothetical protein
MRSRVALDSHPSDYESRCSDMVLVGHTKLESNQIFNLN